MRHRAIVFLTALTMLVLVNSAGAELLGYWPFDEGSGDIVEDISGNGNHGTIEGAQWSDNAIFGSALQFDGVDDRVVVPDSASLHPQTGDLTAEGWVNVASDPKAWSNAGPIVYKGGAYQWAVENNAGALWLGIWGGRLESEGIHDFADVLGEWHHAASTYDDVTQIANIYLNGELVTSGTIAAAIDPTGNTLYIGFKEDGNSWYHGIMDEVRVWDNVRTQQEILDGMFPFPPGIALNPKPVHEATDVERDTLLSWSPGEFAVKHDVYLGVSFDDVNDASAADPLGVLISEGQDGTDIDPGRLAFGQTYYWRVDEVNGAPDFTVHKGSVWDFTVEPIAIPVTNITATASSEFAASLADNTINGSGLTDDLHSVSAADMWISAGIPASIEYSFDRAYMLHELRIWNSNQTIEPFIGFGAKEVVIEHSLDGENWTVLEDVPELAQAAGVHGSAVDNIIDFGGAAAQHVRVSINSVHGFAPQASLSEVRFLYIPTFATRPDPATGALDVAADISLSWGRDGREAGLHDIYLGTDPDNLSKVGSVSDSSYDTSAENLDLSQTYYWRVDEVNDAETPTTWAGDVWSFTTVPTIVIDDMESYEDAEFLEIWATWVDGFEDPANGSLVGNGIAGTPEETIVYGGGQSLPVHYDNSAAPQSEATRTFADPKDWTKHGVQSLTLFFRGAPTNTGGQLYLKINDSKVAYDGAASDLMHLGWNKWTIPLASVDASTLSRVSSLTVGIEGSGSGVLYVDEIQLTTDTRELVTPVQPSDEGLVAHYAFDGDTSDSLGQNPGTLVGNGIFVPGVTGQALNLDGIISYVAIDGLFYDANDFTGVTVTAWIRTQEETDQIIASFDRNEYWRLEINGNGGGPGQVGWDVWTSTGQLDMGSSSRVDDGEWHLVAGVFDNGTATIYIDGYHEAPATGGSRLGTGNLRYGFVGTGSEATAFDGAQTTNYFVGDLDDVRIYHRALSAAEVAGMAGRTEPFDKP